MKTHWIDRVTGPVAPRWTLRRQQARIAAELLQRHYEAAASGRRTQGWHRTSADANAAIGPGLAQLRDAARDLVRNNPYAEAAINTICDHTVGWGIVAKTKNVRAQKAWDAWANSTDCDADGRHNFAGLQKLVTATVAESGEVLVRRRIRRPEDGFALPLQLQVLEPDYLDITKDTTVLSAGGVVARRIIQGVEFDAIGRRMGYWLFPEHPGSTLSRLNVSQFVPAESVAHIYRADRPGQVRAASWFAPVLLRFKDFDEYEDAQLMKQKIAACLAVITSNADGSAPALGTADDVTTTPGVDSLEPGMLLNVAPGSSITVVDPPVIREYADFCKVSLRAIATGIGVTYEDLTGDYTELPFSAARMSRLRHYARVDDWRWNLIVPQFCDPAWAWAMEVAQVMGLTDAATPVEWTAPPMPMIEPDKEGLAYQRNIRTGIMSLSEALRERGYGPMEVLTEIAADNKELDRLGLRLDSDGRYMTQAGQLQGPAATPAATPGEPV
ncbi:MAG TPA: phage portal protein [Burkholderiales bacterium]|nr:phage portal protein [Burkholderiales bacterium]